MSISATLGQEPEVELAWFRDERTKPREAEHLTLRVVGLYQTVAVEKGCFASIKHYLLLLVAHAWHKPQRHPPSPRLLCLAITMAHIGQIHDRRWRKWGYRS